MQQQQRSKCLGGEDEASSLDHHLLWIAMVAWWLSLKSSFIWTHKSAAQQLSSFETLSDFSFPKVPTSKQHLACWRMTTTAMSSSRWLLSRVIYLWVFYSLQRQHSLGDAFISVVDKDVSNNTVGSSTTSYAAQLQKQQPYSNRRRLNIFDIVSADSGQAKSRPEVMIYVFPLLIDSTPLSPCHSYGLTVPPNHRCMYFPHHIHW